MSRLLKVASAGALFVGGYFVGTSAGFSAGVARGLAKADWEWARMLENGSVGPTQIVHPLRGQ